MLEINGNLERPGPSRSFQRLGRRSLAVALARSRRPALFMRQLRGIAPSRARR